MRQPEPEYLVRMLKSPRSLILFRVAQARRAERMNYRRSFMRAWLAMCAYDCPIVDAG